jgi:hypothetical protein
MLLAPRSVAIANIKWSQPIASDYGECARSHATSITFAVGGLRRWPGTAAYVHRDKACLLAVSKPNASFLVWRLGSAALAVHWYRRMGNSAIGG